MSNRSDDPLRKITLNLYEADCEWFERTYGRGWSERIRQHIHNEVLKRCHQNSGPTKKFMLGDLTDEQ